MSSTPRTVALAAARLLLVVAGVGVAADAVHRLATAPPAPPGSGGWVAGISYLVGSVLVVLGLAGASLGVALPAALGAADPLGFDRVQRQVLKAGVALVVAGVLVPLLLAGAGLGSGPALAAGLVAVVLGVLFVCLAIAWRGGEALVGALARAVARARAR